MKKSFGIVGLPNVGKSTLFKKLTNIDITIANYPFATIDPNVGVVPVPDIRLNELTKLSNSKKTVPAILEFYDIAGLVKGASTGEGLGNKFLANIREVDGILHLVRIFKEENITHVEETLNPIRDIEIINLELRLKDLETIHKRLNSLANEAKTGKIEALLELQLLTLIKAKIETGENIYEFAHELTIKQLQLLTAKPTLYILNGDEGDFTSELKTFLNDHGYEYSILNANSDDEIISRFVPNAYAILKLVSFFTTGEDETRAWTIEVGTKAPQAAGVIHTDFEKKFIRLEVVAFQKLIEAQAWSKARQLGYLRLEGKEYVVTDGDVLEVRHG